MKPVQTPPGYDHYTIVQGPQFGMYAVYGMIVLAAFVMLGSRLTSLQNVELLVTVLAAEATLIGRVIWRSIQLNRRYKEHLKHVGNTAALTKLTSSSVYKSYELQGAHTMQADLLEGGPAWNLYDLVVDIYRETKNGKYHAYRKIHTVIEMQLQREVPNVVFDNKHAHGRQLKRLFTHGQQLSFEGGFDNKYDSYAPEGYQIDTFSFISPEVLYAMMQFRLPADVELLGTRLVCTAPILPYDQLELFKQQSFNLYRHLNDNLNTYRDDRLSGEARRTTINKFAAELLRNPWAQWPWMLAAGGLFLALLAIQVSAWIGVGGLQGIYLVNYIFYVGIIFGGQVVWAVRQVVKNRQIRRRLNPVDNSGANL